MIPLPRAAAAIGLGVLAGILGWTCYGAALARQARGIQALRAERLNVLGVPPVPSVARLASLDARDDLAAGLFYGLSAGWVMGGALALMRLGACLPRGDRRCWAVPAGLLLLVGLVLQEWRWPALWIGGLAGILGLARLLAGRWRTVGLAVGAGGLTFALAGGRPCLALHALFAFAVSGLAVAAASLPLGRDA